MEPVQCRSVVPHGPGAGTVLGVRQSPTATVSDGLPGLTVLPAPVPAFRLSDHCGLSVHGGDAVYAIRL